MYKLQACGLEQFIFYLVFIPDQKLTIYKKSKLITKKKKRDKKPDNKTNHFIRIYVI